MAKGDAKTPVAFYRNALTGAYDLSSDVTSWSIVTNTYASVDANAASLNMSDLTVVATAGAYTSATTLANPTLSQSTNTVKFTGDNYSIAADPANPVTGRCIAYYDNTSATDDVLCLVDLTTDGTTAVDLTTGLNVTINANGLLLGTIN